MTEKRPQAKSRRHRSRAEAEQLAVEYEASGLSGQEFCEQKDVALKTLARYLARRRQENAAKSEPQRWVAVEVGGQSGCGNELSVVLSSGYRIEVKRGFDTSTLRQLVTALERV